MIYIEKEKSNGWVKVGTGSRTMPVANKKALKILKAARREGCLNDWPLRIGNPASGYSYICLCDCGFDGQCAECSGSGLVEF